MKKQKKFFNLETYDYTPYARELTEEEMYLVNGGRVVKGSARETEVVSSRPSSSSESGNSSGTSATSNSSPAPAETQTTTGSSQTNSSSQPNNTESQTQTSSAPTCTAAQIAAAKGAATNTYFAEQDKKREENNKQNNNSGSSSSSSSSSSALSHQEQYEMAKKDYDEHYGNVASETSSSSSDSSTAYTTNDQYLMAQKDYDEHYGRSDNSLGGANGENKDLYDYAANGSKGFAADDSFDSIEEAAKDWAKTYADDSIHDSREYQSIIYSYETEKGTMYSYTVPLQGTKKTSTVNIKLENGQKMVSKIHSHGSFDIYANVSTIDIDLPVDPKSIFHSSIDNSYINPQMYHFYNDYIDAQTKTLWDSIYYKKDNYIPHNSSLF